MKPNFAIADAGALAHLEVLDRATFKEVGAVGGRIEQAENGEQGRFSAAGWTGDGNVFAAVDGELDAGEGVGLDFVCDENAGYTFQVDEAFRH